MIKLITRLFITCIYHSQETFADMLQDAGLCHVTYESLSGDIVAIHSGFKPIS